VYDEQGAVAYYSTTGKMYRVMEPGKFYGAGNDSGDGNGLNTIKLIPVYDSGTDQYVIVDPTIPNHIHIRAGGQIDNSNAQLIIGGENTNVTVADSGSVIFLNSAGGQYINSFSSDSQIATIGDISNATPIETSFTVNGGSLGTMPTFDGAPLFSGSYVKTGPMVHFQIQVDMDNITSFGTGQYYVDLPFDAKYGYQFKEGCLHDISASNQYAIGGHVAAGTNRLFLTYTGSNGQDEVFDHDSPVSLNVADNFHISGTYIAQ
jgi:hypothetical protein